MGSLARAPRDLRLLAGAVFLSATGDIVAMITLALVVHDLTGSGFAVSALFATTLVPVIALAGLAGLVADRFESVRVLALASLAQAVVAGGLAFTTDLVALLVLSSLLAAGAAISNPAEFTLVPAVSAKERLTEANGLVEAARYAGFAVGPLLAGAVAALGSARLALLVNAVSFLAIAAAAGLMKARRPPHRGGAARETERARDGLAHLWRDRVLRITVLAAASALVLISASLTIDVFYAHEVLGAGASGYAALYAAWMIGMVAGAAGLAARVPVQALAFGALAALALQGAGVAGQTVWAVLPVALAGSLIGGVGHGVKNTLVRTLIQRRVDEHVQGRAFAAYGAARNAAELGALGLGGILVSAIGPRPALLIAGLGPVIAGLSGLACLSRLDRGAAARLFFRHAEGGATAARGHHVGVRHLEPRAHEVLGVVDG
jgi:MFS family permease